jgi:predicted transcriptional regulator
VGCPSGWPGFISYCLNLCRHLILSKEKMEQITIKLPPNMLEELRKLSEKVTIQCIRQSIAEYLEKNNHEKIVIR